VGPRGEDTNGKMLQVEQHTAVVIADDFHFILVAILRKNLYGSMKNVRREHSGLKPNKQ